MHIFTPFYRYNMPLWCTVFMLFFQQGCLWQSSRKVVLDDYNNHTDELEQEHGNEHELFVLVPKLPEATPDHHLPDELPTAEQHEPVPAHLPGAEISHDTTSDTNQKATDKKATLKAVIAEEKKSNADDNSSLNFPVKNTTGKTLYVCCFSYIKNKDFGRWRWDKSPVYTIKPGDVATMEIDPIPDEQERNHVFGVLGVFEKFAEADAATYQLLDDNRKLELDLLHKLHGKEVTISVEKYGIRGEFYEYDFVKKQSEEKTIASLDFRVKNGTGAPIVITCFVYQKKAKGDWIAASEEKDDMTVWHFGKTPVMSLKPDEEVWIPVDRVVTARDREYMRAYLAVFAKGEEKMAEEAVYELLSTDNKMFLGPLSRLQNQKVIVTVEQYGHANDFIDYVIKPIQHVDFTKTYQPDGSIKHTRTQEIKPSLQNNPSK